MNTKKGIDIDMKIRLGWYLLAAGLILILAAIVLDNFFGWIAVNIRLVAALGVLAAGGAIGVLVKYMTLQKHPDMAKRIIAEETDERSQIIRYRSGNQAFEISMLVSGLILIIYSFMSNDAYRPQPDLLWFVFALMVVIPMAVYIISMIHLQKKY